MKKSLRKIISIFAVIAMLATPIYAADADTMQLEWSADYEEMKLVLDITAPAKYIQTASVVMYPTSVDSPVFTDFVRVGEVTLKGQNKTEYKIKIGNDLAAPNGEYTVRVVGSGNHAYDENKATVAVKIATPTKAGNLLAAINGANASNLVAGDAAITEAKAFLQIDVTGEESSEKLNGFVNTRISDYSGSFATLNDVKDAWIAADVIDCIANSNDTDGFKEAYLGAKDVLGVDMTDSDYTTYEATIYENIKNLKTEIGKPEKKSDVENLLKKAMAMTVVNNTANEGMGAVIEKYHTTLELDATAYSKYAALTNSTEDKNLKTKIHRAITSKNFTKIADLQKAFKDVATGAGGGEGGSGGDGVGSLGGDASANDKTPSNLGGVEGDIAPFVPSQGGFADCSTSHWAYAYVDALKESGIIGGYPDGKFYPENSV
ncbi:MAG: S-layer homology domain-containing protein, partial [Clostridia bacterium]|nr:S-layer homology domain-containing protein [Clostridia bacterium]